MGETTYLERSRLLPKAAFSILERIDVGETGPESPQGFFCAPFSILERIDVGETWDAEYASHARKNFQYPRTDRRG